MNVSQISNVVNNTPALAKSNQSQLDYDTFLKLLVAQMKNQDPTKPMDSTEYIAQLATFSNVEQLITSNKKLDSLIEDSRMSKGVDLIGMRLTSLDNEVSGLVDSVRLTRSGIVAVLEDGKELLVDDQVSISK
ncbi:MAG: flagellar hook assembly protein FlgD [Rhizobiaceae bacterium]